MIAEIFRSLRTSAMVSQSSFAFASMERYTVTRSAEAIWLEDTNWPGSVEWRGRIYAGFRQWRQSNLVCGGNRHRSNHSSALCTRFGRGDQAQDRQENGEGPGGNLRLGKGNAG